MCGIHLPILPGARGESALLRVEEPRAGFFADAGEFCRMGTKETVPQSGLTFAEAAQAEWEQILAEGKTPLLMHFFCTVYYTPREEGFTEEGGYDMRQETRGTLGGRYFARSFLKATSMEGFSRMREPMGDRGYLKYDGTWGYGKYPLGNRNNALEDRRSAAVHRGNGNFTKGSMFLIWHPEIYHLFGSMHFETADTGGGLYESQVDLYWGEDDPTGPYPGTAMPASCPVGVWWIVPVVFAR
ncbi:MAG: hypothetical protein AAF591_16020 [Verrucomicrobiota bacterium]